MNTGKPPLLLIAKQPIIVPIAGVTVTLMIPVLVALYSWFSVREGKRLKREGKLPENDPE